MKCRATSAIILLFLGIVCEGQEIIFQNEFVKVLVASGARSAFFHAAREARSMTPYTATLASSIYDQTYARIAQSLFPVRDRFFLLEHPVPQICISRQSEDNPRTSTPSAIAMATNVLQHIPRLPGFSFDANRMQIKTAINYSIAVSASKVVSVVRPGIITDVYVRFPVKFNEISIFNGHVQFEIQGEKIRGFSMTPFLEISTATSAVRNLVVIKEFNEEFLDISRDLAGYFSGNIRPKSATLSALISSAEGGHLLIRTASIHRQFSLVPVIALDLEINASDGRSEKNRYYIDAATMKRLP